MGIEFKMVESDQSNAVIKVVGVGGAGGNAVAHMIRRGVKGVEFICANTDSQALIDTGAAVQIRLGRTGLGAGAKPEQGRNAAETARDDIRRALHGANMVFLTAGMGGGTGTGAAPIVAEIAKEMGILTVGVVTKPFRFEGSKRLEAADEGVRELAKNVHSLIVVLNEKLQDVIDEDASFEECFQMADDVLHNACAGIAEIINVKGNINVDFQDLTTIMMEPGQAMMGTAVASGDDRARKAAEAAIACPLLEDVDLHGARGVLVNITAGRSLKRREVNEVMAIIENYRSEEAMVVFGQAYDESMGDEMRVTVVATGLGRPTRPSLQVVPRMGIDAANGIELGGMADIQNAPGQYQNYDTPAVFRNREKGDANSRVKAMESSGVDRLDIPAFLRRQAD